MDEVWSLARGQKTAQEAITASFITIGSVDRIESSEGWFNTSKEPTSSAL